jgi:hypothetical protein
VTAEPVERAWPIPGWRRIPGWPHYAVHRDTLEVWSVGRQVPCKGGKTRWAPATRINPTADGRVPLSQSGQVKVVHVARFLHPLTWPETRKETRTQLMCRGSHPLAPPMRPHIFGMFAEPNVTEWGTGNRICLHCHPNREQHPATYSLTYGAAQPPPDHRYSNLPATPKLCRYPADDDYDPDEFFAEFYGEAGGFLFGELDPYGGEDFHFGVTPEGVNPTDP